MKLTTKTITEPRDDSDAYHKVKRGDVRQIVLLRKEFCCKELEKAMDDYFIQFGDDSWMNTDNKLNILHKSCWPSGTVTDYMGINFCPFCGSKIEVINVETEEASK